MTKIFTIATTTILAAALALPGFAQTAAPAAAAQSKATTAAKSAAKSTAKPAPTPAPTDQEISDAKSKGLVWVNLNTKVYHTGGDFYGKTKSGKFMTAADADKAGYKAAKEPVAKAAKKAATKATEAVKK